MAAWKKLTKRILYTHFVINLQSKRKRHMKQWTELCKLGLSLDKTEFLVDSESYAGRKEVLSVQFAQLQ